MMRLKFFTRTFATAKKSSIIRKATAKEVDLFTQHVIREGWHIGPYDYTCGYAFDPKGFFLQEIDGQFVSHTCAVKYPNHCSFLGGSVVAESFRGKGCYTFGIQKSMEACDQNYTVGGDAAPFLKSTLERFGFKTLWETYIAKFSLHKIAAKLATLTIPEDLNVKSIDSIQLEKVLEYDRLVFGTDRRVFLEKWINAPGSFGWVAIRDGVVGYAVMKQATIRGGGREIGMAMAPLYSDDVEIAKCLLKTAAEYCLANDAVPKSELEIVHPVGNGCGEGAPSLMNELEAELIHIAHRMYTKGVPEGRQMKKIYGIATPTFD